ncbi:hypothetical protein DFH29DRAFT_889317 [Suillus ampliporus]|nr:hypothetical protein DFH29DRAFT_889317 [Suillus ampliporus]
MSDGISQSHNQSSLISNCCCCTKSNKMLTKDIRLKEMEVTRQAALARQTDEAKACAVEEDKKIKTTERLRTSRRRRKLQRRSAGLNCRWEEARSEKLPSEDKKAALPPTLVRLERRLLMLPRPLMPRKTSLGYQRYIRSENIELFDTNNESSDLADKGRIRMDAAQSPELPTTRSNVFSTRWVLTPEVGLTICRGLSVSTILP